MVDKINVPCDDTIFVSGRLNKNDKILCDFYGFFLDPFLRPTKIKQEVLQRSEGSS